MRVQTFSQKLCSLISRKFFLFTVGLMLLLALAPTAGGQSVDYSPAAVAKERTALILKATRTPVAQLENEVGHLAVLSEMCRATSGPTACGVSEKPLTSNTIDDRFAYYVRTPVEQHSSARKAKLDLHNWGEVGSTPTSPTTTKPTTADPATVIPPAASLSGKAPLKGTQPADSPSATAPAADSPSTSPDSPGSPAPDSSPDER